MTVRTRLDQRGQLVKEVTVEEGEVTVVVPDPLPSFKPVNVVPPDSVPAGSSSSPRELDTYRLEWAEGYKGLGLLQAGSRVGTPGIGILELLGPPEGPQDGGYGAPAQLASILYPLTAELQEQGEIPSRSLSSWLCGTKPRARSALAGMKPSMQKRRSTSAAS
jgi:hypothetical protein